MPAAKKAEPEPILPASQREAIALVHIREDLGAATRLQDTLISEVRRLQDDNAALAARLDALEARA